MSWQDRRYDDYGNRYVDRGDRPLGTYWLLGLLFGSSLAVWLLGGGVYGAGTNKILDAFALDYEKPFQVWRWLTSAFLHGDVWHLLGNMLMVFFVGRILESFIGTRHFVQLFIGITIFASWGFLVHNMIDPGVALWCIGASGGAIGIVAFLGSRFPMQQLMFFGAFPMRCWALAAIIVGLDVLSVIAYRGQESTARSVHLAGALAGFLYGYVWPKFQVQLEGAVEQREVVKQEKRQQKAEDEKLELDRILTKIKNEGMGELSSREREFLMAQSEKLKDGRK